MSKKPPPPPKRPALEDIDPEPSEILSLEEIKEAIQALDVEDRVILLNDIITEGTDTPALESLNITEFVFAQIALLCDGATSVEVQSNTESYLRINKLQSMTLALAAARMATYAKDVAACIGRVRI